MSQTGVEWRLRQTETDIEKCQHNSTVAARVAADWRGGGGNIQHYFQIDENVLYQ